MPNFAVKSSAFENNSPIPARFTCDGENLSPPLQISNSPAGVKSFTLIADDPDAPGGTWDHWIVFDISPETRVIREGQEPAGVSGRNSWGREGYGGPCPPSGIHRYFFKLYALDEELDLEPLSLKEEVERAMKGHILEQAELVGLYERK